MFLSKCVCFVGIVGVYYNSFLISLPSFAKTGHQAPGSGAGSEDVHEFGTVWTPTIHAGNVILFDGNEFMMDCEMTRMFFW